MLFARMDTSQPYDASNVRTEIRPSKKHSKFWTAKMVNSGRVNTLSHDIPTFSKTPRSVNCARPIKSDNADDERQRDTPRHSKSPARGRRQAGRWVISGHA